MSQVISGVAYFARTHQPDSKFGDYHITIGELSSDTVNQLKELGLGSRIKTSDDKGDHITIRTRNKPTVVDANKKVLEASLFIGNGSKVNVSFDVYKMKQGPNAGKNNAALKAIQIVELVEYAKDRSGIGDFDVVSNKVDNSDESPF